MISFLYTCNNSNYLVHCVIKKYRLSFLPMMKIKNILFIIALFLTSCEKNEANINLKPENIYSIGFGSCVTQERSMPIFNAIKAENYDLFLMLGDNVYGLSLIHI